MDLLWVFSLYKKNKKLWRMDGQAEREGADGELAGHCEDTSQ